MRAGRPWSLRSRLSWAFATSVLLLTLAVILLSAWFQHRSMDRELRGLVLKEQSELVATFLGTDGSREAFVELAATHAARAPRLRAAWRLWSDEGELIARCGDPALLPSSRAAEPRRTRRIGRRVYLRAEPLPDGGTVELAFDGTSHVTMLRRYQAFTLLPIAVASLLAVALGAVFAHRISTLFRRVAEDVRAIRCADQEPALRVENVPGEVRDVAEALHSMLDNIRAESAEARRMIACTAHELRAPIQNLISTTEVALLTAREGSTYRSVLDAQLQDMAELGDAIDSLVTLCSTRNIAAPRELERFDLGRQAEMRLLRERSTAERRGVRFALDVRGDLEVEGDREGLLRAIRNLAASAIASCPHGGTVSIEIEGRDDSVQVTVEGSGEGLEADRESLFEPFSRRPGVRGQRQGYGLGLPLAKVVAERHGGGVWVETAPSAGLRFRLVLPHRVAAETGAEGRALGSSLPSRSCEALP